MRCRLSRAALAAAALAAAALGCARTGPAGPAHAAPDGAPEVRTIVVVANSGLAPGVVRVPAGSRVVLEFQTPRTEHGFFVNDYRIDAVSVSDHRADVAILAGGAARAELYADRPGEYAFHCSREGGSGYLRARGRLVVQPEPDCGSSLARERVGAAPRP